MGRVIRLGGVGMVEEDILGGLRGEGGVEVDGKVV